MFEVDMFVELGLREGGLSAKFTLKISDHLVLNRHVTAAGVAVVALFLADFTIVVRLDGVMSQAEMYP